MKWCSSLPEIPASGDCLLLLFVCLRRGLIVWPSLASTSQLSSLSLQSDGIIHTYGFEQSVLLAGGCQALLR